MGGLFTPWDASQETAAEDTSLEKIYAVQRDPVNLPPLPQENWGGMFSPWEADDTSLNKIYAVQSDPVAQIEPRYEVLRARGGAAGGRGAVERYSSISLVMW